MQSLHVIYAFDGETVHHPKIADKDMDWWNSLSHELQKKYLEEHPASKYGKLGVTHKEGHDPHKNNLGKKVQRQAKFLSEEIKDMHSENKKFFEDHAHVPDSPERSKLAATVNKKKAAIKASVKHELKEWRTGIQVFKKMKNGEKLTPEDKKAIKKLLFTIGGVTASVALSGGLAHPLAVAASHLASDFVYHAAAEQGLKLAVYSAVKSSDSTDDSDEDEALLEELIGLYAKGLKSAKVPTSKWLNLVKEAEAKTKD